MDPIERLSKISEELDITDSDQTLFLKCYLVGVRRDGGFGENHHYEYMNTVFGINEEDAEYNYRQENKQSYNAVEVLCQVPKSLAGDSRLRTTTGLYEIISQLANLGNEFDNLIRKYK